MTKEALTLALEALEKLTDAAEGFSVSGVYFNEELWARKCLDDAYDAMGFAQEALAQPEQEPVAEIVNHGGYAHVDWKAGVKHPVGTKFYTTPPQHVLMAEHWKSLYEQLKASAYAPDDGALTEEQINQIRKTAPQRPWVSLTHKDIDKAIEDNQRFGGFRKVGFAYDLEALLKEKNT